MSTIITSADARQRFGRHHLAAQIRAGRWARPARGVIALHNGPLDVDEREEVALLASARGSALAGLSSLRRDGFEGFASDRPVVVQPMGARRPQHRDVTVHWSEYLDDRDVHPRARPRRTRTARSLVDAASWEPHERYARVIVLAGVQQRLTSTRHLREALTRRGNCRHRALIVESILDAHGGIQSLPERDFDEICRRLGLPPPDRQAAVKAPTGRYYLDVEWKDYGVSVEIHGIPHLRIHNWDADLDRANEIAITGRRQLTFSSYAVRRHPRRVGDQLVRMLGLGGWVPTQESAYGRP